VVVFSYNVFFIGDGGISQFFLVGGGGEKYVPPPTHTFNSGTAQMFVVDNVHQYMIMIKKLMKQIQVQQV
jgi:hypothetical protein